jgi:membrane protease YdiL (CAAX protease family)
VERRPRDVETGPIAPVRWGLGDFIWVYFAGLLLGVIFGTVGLAFSGDQADDPGALTTALSAGGQFGGWAAGAYLVARTKGHSLRRDFGFVVRSRDWWWVLAGIGLFVVAVTVVLPITLLADETQGAVENLEDATGAKLVVFALLAAVVAPVCEELLFRGVLLRSLRRRLVPVAAIGVQALVFALAHPLLSPSLGDLAVVPALFLMGAVSGVVAEARGDLSPSILLHVGFNLVTTVAAVL